MYNTRRKAIQSQISLLSMLACSSGLTALAKPAEAEAMVASFGFDPDLMNNLLVRIQLEKDSVCGFIAKMDGKFHVLTNTQLISGHNRFTLSTLSGTALRPSRIELSTTRDIARIQIESEKGLGIASNVVDETTVSLVDFSSSGSSFSEIGGMVQSANKERFDISIPFSAKHCGSPVLNADMQVCGITSNIDYYKSTGATWGSTARHFVYKIEGTSWFSPNWKQYDKFFGKPLREADTFREQIYALAVAWMKNLKSRIETDEDVGLDVERWIKQHNGMVSNLGRKRSSKGGSNPTKGFQKDFSDSCNALVDICSSKAKTLTFVSEQKNATPYIGNQFKWRARELMQFIKFVRAFEKSKDNYRW
jgi:hypothetical protein